MATLSQEQLVEELSSWTVAEVAGLVKALETKWGVSAAPVAVAGGGGGGAAAAAPVEEQTEFTVELTGGGDKKIRSSRSFAK
jgi:large subunit ribosomal protein L7/L12